MNPALAARAFLFSWPVIMTTWVQPGDWAPLFGSSADAVTSATPLASLHQSALPAESLMSLFLGKTGGCLGETSALLLLWAACTWFSGGSSVCGFPLLIWVPWPFSPCSFPGERSPFVDGKPSPLRRPDAGRLVHGHGLCDLSRYRLGQILYGVGCGCITVLIRYFGSIRRGQLCHFDDERLCGLSWTR